MREDRGSECSDEAAGPAERRESLSSELGPMCVGVCGRDRGLRSEAVKRVCYSALSVWLKDPEY